MNKKKVLNKFEIIWYTKNGVLSVYAFERGGTNRMDSYKLLITGGIPLMGETYVSGGKNTSVAVMVAPRSSTLAPIARKAFKC